MTNVHGFLVPNDSIFFEDGAKRTFQREKSIAERLAHNRSVCGKIIMIKTSDNQCVVRLLTFLDSIGIQLSITM